MIKRGGLLRSTKLANAEDIDVSSFYDQLIFGNELTGNEQLTDKLGNTLFCNEGKAPIFLMENLRTVVKWDSICTVSDLMERGRKMYHLALSRSGRVFSTDVYLSAKDKSLIDKYYKTGRKQYIDEKIAKRQAKAKADSAQHVAEEELLRTFEIAQFGIYNYDRVIETESMLHLAATFSIPGIDENANVTIFLVTRMDGNAVTKYPEGTWGRFSIDTAATNTILTVLPGNEIAICTEEELRRIDWAGIRDKKYAFALRRTGKKVSSMAELEQLLNSGRLAGW